MALSGQKVIFDRGQFTHICQLNVSCGQDSVSGLSGIVLLSCSANFGAPSINKLTQQIFKVSSISLKPIKERLPNALSCSD
jgi:hypothetical protein